MKRIALVIAFLFALALMLPLAACSKQEFVTNASDVIASLKATRPLVQNLVDAGKIDAERARKTFERFDSADKLAEKLKTSFEQGDQGGAIKTLQQVITAVDEIAIEDATLFPEANSRLLFLTTLAGANIALHFLANRFHKDLQAITPAQKIAIDAALVQDPELDQAYEAVERFNEKPEWGRTYAR